MRQTAIIFLAGARTIMIMSKTASVLWVNSFLMKCNAILSKISCGITDEHKMELRNAPAYPFEELLPSLTILWAVENVVRKAFSFDRKPQATRPSRQQWFQGAARSRSSSSHCPESAFMTKAPARKGSSTSKPSSQITKQGKG